MMRKILSDYGTVGVLLLLCAALSVATLQEQDPAGADGARRLASRLKAERPSGGRLLVVGGASREEREFVETLTVLLKESLFSVTSVAGEPRDARVALEQAPQKFDLIACSRTASAWAVLENAGIERVTPPRTRWPNFLKAENLVNVADQIAVIAILSVGMTLVIVSGGIDLSVGSLLALSAVVVARLIRDGVGGEQAGAGAMIVCALAAITLSAAGGFFNGAMVTSLSIPPFIVTLAMMLAARGLAYIVAQRQSISQLPDGFMWLGRGSQLGLPNAVVLMAALFAAAHVLMSRTTLGRYLYAVGGNAEAARLSGVPVRRVRLFAYTVCGATAGLGGVLMASQLKSGAPTYGTTYELSAIAAVVVGGTSLSGGEGRVLGTLVGALIIAVIQNGMNLMGIDSDPQMIVFAGVILGAAILDRLKRPAARPAA
jgi:ribose transport system permease protein